MRISLNWIKQFVKIPALVKRDNLSAEDFAAKNNAELVRLIGARLVEVEEVIDETHKYDNIYIVRVELAERIPETHLTKCLINAGELDLPGVERDESGLIQVMCGAPNVREGMLAVWIAPGAIVPASVHEDAPFIIGKRKMLKIYDSYGMLAGADELDFGDDHSGIVEINPEEARPGDSLAEIFDLHDLILDIENKSLTHRPDTFGVIGFAREVAGILGEEFKEDSGVATFYKAPKKTKSSDALNINIINPEICARYSAVILEKHGEIKRKYLSKQDILLAKSGMRPIEPIVDATNYLMLLTGQPLHAFDYDKFIAVAGSGKPEIVVRLARTGEQLRLLDDKEITLNPDDIVICSGETPVALAGAMGGETTAIDEATRNIIIESATFSLYHLRKTQMAHGIFSEAITRFTKGQPSYQTLAVAEECAKMLADGFVIKSEADEYEELPEPIKVRVSVDEINQLLGTNYSDEEIVRTLANVGFQVARKKDALEIIAPVWRTDIHIKEDIIEEIGRLNGFDNIQPILPLHATANRSPEFSLKQELRHLLSKYGANELLTYSFVSGNLLKRAKQDLANSYKIVNSISPDLQYIRQSIVPSLLEKAYMNEKLPVEKMALFEMNKVYQKAWGENQEDVPVEKTHLGLVIAERKNTETAYYKAKKYLDGVLAHYQIEVKYLPLSNDYAEARMLEKSRAAEIRSVETDEVIGVIGELKNSVRHEFKLTEYTAVAEIDLEKIIQLKNNQPKIQLGERKVIDETIETEASYIETYQKMCEKYPGAMITPLSIYQGEQQEAKKISFHIERQN